MPTVAQRGSTTLPPRSRGRQHDALTAFGLVVITCLLFVLSGGVLWTLGYNYDGLTGSTLTKIHPATYAIVALFCWSLVASGEPVRRLLHLAHRRPASTVMGLASILVLMVFVIRQSPGMAGIVDTYLAPALLVLLLVDADERTMQRLEYALHGIMMINALLGLYEFATKNLLFPYRFDGDMFENDTRSAALQGHPLINAMTTACYLMALASSGRPLNSHLRFTLIVLQMAALVTFGGRTALLACLLFGGAYGLVALFARLRGRRVHLLESALALTLLLLLPLVLGFLWASGFFDAMLARFEADGGSANARKEMFELVIALPLRDLIIGPDTAWVDSMRRIHGLEWGIENPFIRMLVYNGLLIALLLAVTFSLFLLEIARHCLRGVWLPMIVSIILLNAAETIGSKTNVAAKFALIMLCLYRMPRRDTVAPARDSFIEPAASVPARRSFPDRGRGFAHP